MDKQKIIDALRWRTAIKTFDEDKKISDEDFAFLLQSARLAPSSFGFEPWNIIVLQNPELRDAIKLFAWGAARQLTTSHFVAFTVKTDLKPESKYFEHILKDVMKVPANEIPAWRESFTSFSEKNMKMQTDRERHDWACKQAYIALANMMAAAAMIGIDSCPIEGFDYDKVEEILSAHDAIDLETDRIAVMCAFGYRKGEIDHPKTRRDMDEIVKWIR